MFETIVIDGFENYTVSYNGDIKNKKTGKVLKPQKVSGGYYQVHLFKDGKMNNVLVHRIVAKAFVPNPNNLPQVNHKDENKANNNADNLEWCTCAYNMQYSYGKPFGQYKNGTLLKIWNSTREVERAGIAKRRNIQNALKIANKICKGFEWKYVSSYQSTSKKA